MLKTSPLLISVTGTGQVEYVDWPAEKKAIDIGDFYADSSKFQRTTGWAPTTSLGDGFARTVAFYRQHFDHYVSTTTGAAQV